MCKVSAVIHGSDRATVARVALRMCNRYGWACATAAPNRLDFVTQQNLSPEETSKRLRLLLDSVRHLAFTVAVAVPPQRCSSSRGSEALRSAQRFLRCRARVPPRHSRTRGSPGEGRRPARTRTSDASSKGSVLRSSNPGRRVPCGAESHHEVLERGGRPLGRHVVKHG
jgi:hypothetical protein